MLRNLDSLLNNYNIVFLYNLLGFNKINFDWMPIFLFLNQFHAFSYALSSFHTFFINPGRFVQIYKILKQ